MIQFEVGDIVTIPLTVEYIDEFDSGYSRKPSFRIIFSDAEKIRYEWETSGKFELKKGEIVNLQLKVKRILTNFDGKFTVVLKR